MAWGVVRRGGSRSTVYSQPRIGEIRSRIGEIRGAGRASTKHRCGAADPNRKRETLRSCALVVVPAGGGAAGASHNYYVRRAWLWEMITKCISF